ncbi:hypothetical protein [Actinoplanes sp. NPDC051851]|uniref:hypothetical protein n=1 Tax=Actinoplanes sp. NPDC051851 TaxID=3154753 RepID=UPI003426826B
MASRERPAVRDRPVPVRESWDRAVRAAPVAVAAPEGRVGLAGCPVDPPVALRGAGRVVPVPQPDRVVSTGPVVPTDRVAPTGLAGLAGRVGLAERVARVDPDHLAGLEALAGPVGLVGLVGLAEPVGQGAVQRWFLVGRHVVPE